MAEIFLPTLSVIVTNYNYAKFVSIAIESLLAQSADMQIIVVDDCSTDDSREIISKYEDKIITVFQEYNQGHGAGFNAGFQKATGELVMFLDADDFMLPGGAEIIRNAYDPEVVMYHYRMRYADEEGNLAGVHPPLERPLASGDISSKLRTTGLYDGTVTSGLVYKRGVLSKVLPMDPEAYRQGGDGYLSACVPLYGRCASSSETISAYRLHGMQHSKFEKAHAKRARWCLEHDAHRYESITEHSEQLGLEVDSDLASRNYFNVHNLLISLLFEPELHPVKNDRVKDLIKRGKVLNAQTASGGSLLVRQLYWNALAVLPMAQKKALLKLEVDKNARPRWMNSLGRVLRKRLKITIN